MKMYTKNLQDSLKQNLKVNVDSGKEESLNYNELNTNSRKLEKELQNKQEKEKIKSTINEMRFNHP